MPTDLQRSLNNNLNNNMSVIEQSTEILLIIMI